MTSFTDDEIAFMNAQPLARIATVSADGQPDVVPVGFGFDGTCINIGGYQPATTRRHHNILGGNSWSWNLGGQPLSHGESFTPPKRTVHQEVTS